MITPAVEILLITSDSVAASAIQDYLATLPSPGGTLSHVRSTDEAAQFISECIVETIFIAARLFSPGFQILARRAGCDAPVVVLVEDGQHTQGEEYLLQGAADYLQASELNANSVRRCLRYIKIARRARDFHQTVSRRQQDFLEASVNAIWRLDLHEPLSTSQPLDVQVRHILTHGVIGDCNTSAATMHGHPALQDLLGASLADIFQSETERQERISAFVSSNYRLPSVEGTQQRSDGQTKTLLTTLNGFVQDGLLLSIWGTQRDVTEERAAAARLRASEARWRGLFEAEMIGQFVADEFGTITEANDAFLRLIDYQRSDLPLRWDLLTPPEYAGVDQALIAALKRGDAPPPYEKEFITRSGSRVPVLLGGSLVAGSTQEGYCFVLDLRKQKEATAALERSEAQHKEAQSIAHLGHFTGIRDTENFVWSDEVFRIYGYEPNAVSPTLHTVMEATHPDDRERMAASIARFMEDHQPAIVSHRIVRPDGEIRWLDVHVQVAEDSAARIVGIVHDVTERRQAELAVRTGEARWQSVIEALAEGILVFDASGHRSHWNHAALQLHGIENEEQWRQELSDPASVYELRTLDDKVLPFSVWPVKRVLRGETLRDITLKVRRPYSGWERILRYSGALVHDEADQPQLGFLTVTDETARHEAEAALKQAHDQLELRVLQRTLELEQANREAETARQVAEAARLEAERANQAKSEFLSRMSHELRTPMNSILGFAQILEMNTEKEKDKERIGHILRAGDHLLELIDEVLDLARVESGRVIVALEPVRVHVLLNSAVDLIRPLAQRANLSLRVHSEDTNDGWITADMQRLSQVLLNLLSNAVKYNRPGGTIEAGCDPCSNGKVRLWVRDTGPGISQENLSRLFTPFERLGREMSAIPGTGLGLALSQRLIEAMGGSMGVESEVGVGSTFWLELDAVKPGEESAPPVQKQAPTANPILNVICIEDNLVNLQVIQDIFEHMPGLRLIPAMQGGLGLELAMQHKPALILLDLNLPDMNGDEVLRRLRERPETASVPVVVISADATQQQIRRLLDAGAAEYLTKPVDVRRLLEVTQELLGIKVE